MTKLKTIAAFGFCLLALGCNKRQDAGGEGGSAASAKVPATPPVPGTLVVTAKLVDVPGEFPPNELYNYAYIMKYEVQKVIQGSYDKKEILVGHYNPRFARSEIKDDQKAKVGGNVTSFNVGDVHYLVLNEIDKVWSGALEDNYYKDLKSTRYWASWADKL